MGLKRSLPNLGFAESEHTADLALIVWGANLPALFVNSAKGMFSSSGAEIKKNYQPQTHHIELNGEDNETLLINFLTELLYISERDHVGFNEYQVFIDGNTLLADITAIPLQSIEKHIKAVTYHDLAICQTDSGYQVEIVFDI